MRCLDSRRQLSITTHSGESQGGGGDDTAGWSARLDRLRNFVGGVIVRTMSTSSYSGVHTVVFHDTIPRLSLHVHYLRMLQNSSFPRERPLPTFGQTATYHQVRSRQPHSTFTYALVHMLYGVQHLDRRTAVVVHEGTSGEDPFSPELRNKKEAELYIRHTESGLRVLPFTKSKVVINIYDPEGTDLSFMDLPGLIENDRTDVIKLIDDLTLEYISQSSTVILVTAPADDEVGNQKAMPFGPG
ncbi:hypothetical protein OH76DRAFT_144682 [Lentinus brumalis]|uniref:G domain-containing protein n=1 Tax=Lentinus brumalis TaxID=2498619 RepID=A0A371CPG7_9APHY|nr:hypothetical protein OH76DRAFT_144682 [Polyporus brumalis]